MIAPTKRIEAIGSVIPFDEIYSTVFEKPKILLGIADINIDEIATLAMKSKKFFVDLFLIVRSLIIFLELFLDVFLKLNSSFKLCE